jgi:murein DD-endopeptidase MepM/ murein hydrolase activator NlpD
MAEPRYLSIMVVPEDGRESHTFRVTYRSLKLAAGFGLTMVLGVAVLAGSWWYLAARAAKVPELEAQVAQHAEDQARMEAFATQLVELEKRYEQIRQLFGPDGQQVASGLWLPPPAPRGAAAGPDSDDGGGRPTSWPLTERGFVTQRLLEGEGGAHPGLDIAVPTDSYIRAAGAGVVVEVRDDPVYGRFVSLDHGEGYRTVYAHASVALVEVGQKVRRNELIALSGSTGRSTAPHLHFEILHNGEPVDPLSMVRQP